MKPGVKKGRLKRMATEGGEFALVAAEKFFGLILLIVGILSLYYTLTSADALTSYTGFFGFLNVIILLLGVFLLVAKIE